MRDSENQKKAETAIFFAFEDYSPADQSEPEKMLMAAILKSALEDLKHEGAPQRDAKRYLLVRDDRHLYAFESVCLHLGLCANTIRALLGLGIGLNIEGEESENVRG